MGHDFISFQYIFKQSQSSASDKLSGIQNYIGVVDYNQTSNIRLLPEQTHIMKSFDELQAKFACITITTSFLNGTNALQSDDLFVIRQSIVK